MTKRQWWMPICVIGLTMLGTVATGAAAPRSTSTPDTIHLVFAGGGPLTTFDSHEPGPTFGDRLVAKGPLTDPGTGLKVGTAYLDCTIITHDLNGGAYWCRYLLDLRSGQVIVEGLDPRGPSDSVFSIDGGTRAYRQARGDAEFNDGPTQTDIYLHLDLV